MFVMLYAEVYFSLKRLYNFQSLPYDCLPVYCNVVVNTMYIFSLTLFCHGFACVSILIYSWMWSDNFYAEYIRFFICEQEYFVSVIIVFGNVFDD